MDLTTSSSLNWDKEEDYQSFDVDEVRANMGLILDLPLNRVNERNSYRTALINFERQLRSLQQTLDTRRDVIRQALRTLEQRRKNYVNNTLGVTIAERRVSELKLRVAAGTVDQQSFIDAQNSLIQEQNGLVDAIVEYQKSRLQLLLDIGNLESEQDRFWLVSEETNAREAAATLDPEQVATIPVVTPDQLFQEQSETPPTSTQEQQ